VPSLPGVAATAPAPVGDGPPCWLLGVGATYGAAKAWPTARMAELLRLAVRERGVRIVLVGADEARPQAARLRAAGEDLPWRTTLPGGAAVVDLTGRTDLGGLVALVRAAAGYVGNDSGPMHLAAALGVPTVGVFGSSSPRWTAPLGPRAEAVAATGFACHPCFLKRCPREVFCLDTVAAATVVDRLVALGAADNRDTGRRAREEPSS
jgi:heptosyltransferase-2